MAFTLGKANLDCFSIRSKYSYIQKNSDFSPQCARCVTRRTRVFTCRVVIAQIERQPTGRKFVFTRVPTTFTYEQCCHVFVKFHNEIVYDPVHGKDVENVHKVPTWLIE